MTARRVVVALALTVALAGCGGAGTRNPPLSALPLARGARITAKVLQCDPGANAYCAVALVITNPHSPSSPALVEQERRALLAKGWRGASPDIGDELADESPGHKLRVTYSTAAGDLKGIDLGWIKRPRAVALALSRAMFTRTPAISVLYEIGSQ